MKPNDPATLEKELEARLILLIPGDEILRWLASRGLSEDDAADLVKDVSARIPNIVDTRRQRMIAGVQALYTSAAAKGDHESAARYLDQLRKLENEGRAPGGRGRRVLTDEQIEEAGARYIAGESASAIALSLGVGESTLRRYFGKAGIRADDRVAGTSDDDNAPDPEDWGKLIDSLDDPPDDPMEWAGWARKELTKIANYRIRHPRLPTAYARTLHEYRQTLRDAMGARQEDLVHDALQTIKKDVEELEDPGPEVKDLAARSHRRDRKSTPG